MQKVWLFTVGRDCHAEKDDFSQSGRVPMQKSMVFHSREGVPGRKVWFFTAGGGDGKGW